MRVDILSSGWFGFSRTKNKPFFVVVVREESRETGAMVEHSVHVGAVLGNQRIKKKIFFPEEWDWLVWRSLMGRVDWPKA
jgi:hypothetical protein